MMMRGEKKGEVKEEMAKESAKGTRGPKSGERENQLPSGWRKPFILKMSPHAQTYTLFNGIPPAYKYRIRTHVSRYHSVAHIFRALFKQMHSG